MTKKKIHKERKIAIISGKRKKFLRLNVSIMQFYLPMTKKMKFNLTQTDDNVQTHTSEL